MTMDTSSQRRWTRGFTAQLRLRAHYTHLYDRAGLMVRVGARAWMKAGIEFTGKPDWSIAALDGDTRDV